MHRTKSQRDPSDIRATAAWLLERYGHHAPLHAAVCADNAIKLKDVDACNFWREVFNLLDQQMPASEAAKRPPVN